MPVSTVAVWEDYEDTLTNTIGGHTETDVVSVSIPDDLWDFWEDVTWAGDDYLGAKAAFLITGPPETETYSGAFQPDIEIYFRDVEFTTDWTLFGHLELWDGNPSNNGGRPRIFAYLKGRTVEWKVTASGGFAGVETYHWTGFNLTLVPQLVEDVHTPVEIIATTEVPISIVVSPRVALAVFGIIAPPGRSNSRPYGQVIG